jgi:hypothetical protein
MRLSKLLFFSIVTLEQVAETASSSQILGYPLAVQASRGTAQQIDRNICVWTTLSGDPDTLGTLMHLMGRPGRHDGLVERR